MLSSLLWNGFALKDKTDMVQTRTKPVLSIYDMYYGPTNVVGC